MQPRQRKRASLGSGVIVDGKKALVLTNSHVVQSGTDIPLYIRVSLSVCGLSSGAGGLRRGVTVRCTAEAKPSGTVGQYGRAVGDEDERLAGKHRYDAPHDGLLRRAVEG